MAVTTIGRELLRSKLPDKYKHYADTVLDSKGVKALTTELAKDDPDAYIDILQELNRLGQSVVSTYGRDAALSFAGLKIDRELVNLKQKMRELQNRILADDSLSEKQKEDKIKELGYKYTQKVQDAVLENNKRRSTALANQIVSGTRGKPVQLMQLQFGNMLMKDALNRDIPYLMLDAYGSGTTPMGYWISASSGRKGIYDTQAATGQAGYLGKQVTAATHDTVISEEDCGTTDTGIPQPANSTKNVGAVLLRPFHNHPAGSVVTEEMVSEADDDEEMLVRSPMTCKSPYGVCARCSGIAENGKFPAIGEYVALNSARSFVEPMTQGGISCLHPDTLVQLADFSVKRIADIVVGDIVVGVDKTGKGMPVRVLHVYNHGKMPMQLYTYKADSKEVFLTATTEHKALQIVDNEETPVVCPIGIKKESVYMVPFQGYIYDADHTVCKPMMKRSSVKELGMFDAYDIEVDHPDHLFLLANGLVVSNSKHAGGVGGKRVEDPDGDDQPTGFKAVERMFMAPSNFPGGAVLAPVDGRVIDIQKASQGGHYIHVGDRTVYASPKRTIKVGIGDQVYAGDMLTNGVPNPSEIVSYKGIGEGRLYFAKKMDELLKKQGWATDRRNVEALSGALLSKVKITDPDGYRNWLPGEIVSYSELASGWEPREGSQTVNVDKAVNKYLEKPVLYYNIGTRITPAVRDTLKKFQFNDVTVSDKEPPFTSQFLRPAVVLQNDRNWLPRLAGERLRDGLFDAARTGITDPYNSPSYVDKIVAAPFQK